METNDTTHDRYRVALLNAGGQVEAWLTPRLALTNVAWEAGQFTWADAKGFAAWARTHVRRGLEACEWTPVPVPPPDPRVSPAGDRRERPVPCDVCRAETWNMRRLCDEHLSEPVDLPGLATP